VPQNLRDGQHIFGYKSDVLSFGEHQFKYGVDISYSSHGQISRKIYIIYNIIKLSFQYDVFHFHTASLHSTGLDLIIWKFVGKKVIMHYHGSEIRNKKQPLFHKYFVDRYIVSTPDLLAFVPNSLWLPNPIDTKKHSFVEPNLQPHRLRIIHAPSTRSIKGTEYVIQAINQLKKDGYDFEFILLENTSHDEILRQLRIADIAVDWINPDFGIYGVFSIEAMCMGKPVLCCVKKDLVDKHYHNLPILNTSPEFVYENLIKLIENPEQRIELGAQGRKYVERIHESREITKKIVDLYTDKWKE
jgi:glycosyltransferase involved in cell wall biosynthesis